MGVQGRKECLGAWTGTAFIIERSFLTPVVRINNGLDGLNSRVLDAYLRNVHDSSASIEVQLLDVLNHLISETERDGAVVVSPLLKSREGFLEELRTRYHKRPFHLDAGTPDPVYDRIGRMVRFSEKMLAYNLSDVHDFMIDHPEVLLHANIHPNILLRVGGAIEKFHKRPIKQIPLQKEVPIQTKRPPVHDALNRFPKYNESFALYTAVASNIKRLAVDFEILKLYDFLQEEQPPDVQSPSLFEVYPAVQMIGEAEYCKQAIDLAVDGGETPQDEFDIVIEEWSSNIRRGIQLRKAIGEDFVSYLNRHASERDLILYRSGAYPELTILVKQSFADLGMPVPDGLQPYT